MIFKERFINSRPKEVAVYLHERAPETLEETAKIADQYLGAHGKRVISPGRNKPPTPPEKDANKKPPTDSTPLQCHRCNFLPGNAICMEGMAMKQETVIPMCQSQEGKTRTVSLCRETSLVPHV